MNTFTVKQIATGEEGQITKNLGNALKSVVIWSRQQGIYESLFLAKQQVEFNKRGLPCEIEPLLDAGILAVEDQPVRSLKSNLMVHVDPHLAILPELSNINGIFIATDWPDTPPKANSQFDGREMVFPLHYESFAVIKDLVRLLDAGAEFGTALDMFAGSGVIGIYAHRMGIESITSADILQRSVAFTMLNAFMSDVGNASFIISDCLQNIPAYSRFDLILGNPPFEPILPDDRERYFYHSYGGRNGHQVMDKFLNKVPEYLSERGVLLLVDFLYTDDTWGGLKSRIAEVQNIHPQIVRSILTTRCYGEFPLSHFWIKYDALGLDREQELRTNFFVDTVTDPKKLVLATLLVTPHEYCDDLEIQAKELVFEDRPPPNPWWNPLDWPLPCGVSIEPQNISWFSLWSQHEYELRSEFGALYAERIASSPDKGIEHIDFLNLLSYTNHLANGQMASALRATVLNAHSLCIGSVQLPESISLCLLPFETDEKAHLIQIDSPSLPSIQIPRLRSTDVDMADSILFKTPTMKELQEKISRTRRSPTTLILCFTVSNPLSMGKVFDDLPYHAYRRSDMPYVGRHFLVWNGNKYEAPGYSEDSGFTDEDLIHSSIHEVQRFLLFVNLPNNTIQALEKLQTLGLPKWQKVVSDQLGSFMRDQLTLFAFPFLLVSQTTQSMQEMIALANAHNLRSAIENAIITPLITAVESDNTEKSLRERVNDAISCVKHYHRNLTLLLDGCADIVNLKKALAPFIITKRDIEKIITSDNLNLAAYGARPDIEVSMQDDVEISLALPRRTFDALLTLLIVNTLDAMHAADLNFDKQKINIEIEVASENSKYCILTIRNSGTKFRADVIQHGGTDADTVRPQRKRSGMGLFFINTILSYVKAKRTSDRQYIELSSTENPPEAQISMYLPIVKEM